MNKLVIAAIIIMGLGIAYYSLYQYNYNEAKNTMSLVMPDMLAYAQGLNPEDYILNETALNETFDRLVRLLLYPEFHRLSLLPYAAK